MVEPAAKREIETSPAILRERAQMSPDEGVIARAKFLTHSRGEQITGYVKELRKLIGMQDAYKYFFQPKIDAQVRNEELQKTFMEQIWENRNKAPELQQLVERGFTLTETIPEDLSTPHDYGPHILAALILGRGLGETTGKGHAKALVLPPKLADVLVNAGAVKFDHTSPFTKPHPLLEHLFVETGKPLPPVAVDSDSVQRLAKIRKLTWSALSLKQKETLREEIIASRKELPYRIKPKELEPVLKELERLANQIPGEKYKSTANSVKAALTANHGGMTLLDSAWKNMADLGAALEYPSLKTLYAPSLTTQLYPTAEWQNYKKVPVQYSLKSFLEKYHPLGKAGRTTEIDALVNNTEGKATKEHAKQLIHAVQEARQAVAETNMPMYGIDNYYAIAMSGLMALASSKPDLHGTGHGTSPLAGYEGLHHYATPDQRDAWIKAENAGKHEELLRELATRQDLMRSEAFLREMVGMCDHAMEVVEGHNLEHATRTPGTDKKDITIAGSGTPLLSLSPDHPENAKLIAAIKQGMDNHGGGPDGLARFAKQIWDNLGT